MWPRQPNVLEVFSFVSVFIILNDHITKTYLKILTPLKPTLHSKACYFVLMFFSPFSIAITSLWEERANLSVFRTFVRFALVWICRFLLPLGVWEGLRFVIVAIPGLFSYLFFLMVYTLCFLFLLKHIDRRGGSDENPQSMVWAEILKITRICTWKLSGFGGIYLNRSVFVIILFLDCIYLHYTAV